MKTPFDKLFITVAPSFGSAWVLRKLFVWISSSKMKHAGHVWCARSHEELSFDTGIPPHTIERHLRALRDAGLIVCVRGEPWWGSGNRNHIRLTTKCLINLGFNKEFIKPDNPAELQAPPHKTVATEPAELQEPSNIVTNNNGYNGAGTSGHPQQDQEFDEWSGKAGEVKAAEITKAHAALKAEEEIDDYLVNLALDATTTAQYAKVWQVAVKKFNPELPMVSELTNADKAKLYKFITTFGEGHMLVGCLQHWKSLTRFVTKTTGLPNPPKYPRVGYLLQHKDTVFLWWQEHLAQAPAADNDEGWEQFDDN